MGFKVLQLKFLSIPKFQVDILFIKIIQYFRLATSPLLSLERHQKGVLALSWCQQDPDLLLSASKDGKVLCWNPNNNIAGGEVLSELCSTGQWIYDVQWCPKNPNLVAACSNDGRVGIYSINGGAHLPPVHIIF